MPTLVFNNEPLTVTVRGRTLNFWPLNFKHLRALMDAKPEGASSPLAQLLQLLHASSNQNGQTVTEDELAELLDPATANVIISALSTLREAPQDAGKAA